MFENLPRFSYGSSFKRKKLFQSKPLPISNIAKWETTLSKIIHFSKIRFFMQVRYKICYTENILKMYNVIKNILCHLKTFLDLTYCVFFVFFISRNNFLISYTKPCYHPQSPTISHNYPQLAKTTQNKVPWM